MVSKKTIDLIKLYATKGQSPESIAKGLTGYTVGDVEKIAKENGIKFIKDIVVEGWTEEDKNALLKAWAINPPQGLLRLFPDKTWADIEKAAGELNLLSQDRIFHLDSKKEVRRVNNIIHEQENTIAKLEGELVEASKQRLYIDLPKHRYNTSYLEDKMMYLTFADWHFFSNVEPKLVGHIAAYTPELAKKRLWAIVSKYINLILMCKPKTVRIAFLGDLINGIIHESRNANVYDMTDTKLLTEELMADTIREISKYAAIEKVIGLSGNHARMSEKVKLQDKGGNNHETEMNARVRNAVSNIVDPDNFIVEKGADHMDIAYGIGYVFTHGDLLKGGTNNKPGVNGSARSRIEIAAAEYSKRSAIQGYVSTDGVTPLPRIDWVEALICGHFHTFWDSPGNGTTRLIASGSLIGGDEYSYNVLGKAGAIPSQLAILVDETGIDTVFNVKVPKQLLFL